MGVDTAMGGKRKRVIGDGSVHGEDSLVEEGVDTESKSIKKVRLLVDGEPSLDGGEDNLPGTLTSSASTVSCVDSPESPGEMEVEEETAEGRKGEEEKEKTEEGEEEEEEKGEKASEGDDKNNQRVEDDTDRENEQSIDTIDTIDGEAAANDTSTTPSSTSSSGKPSKKYIPRLRASGKPSLRWHEDSNLLMTDDRRGFFAKLAKLIMHPQQGLHRNPVWRSKQSIDKGRKSKTSMRALQPIQSDPSNDYRPDRPEWLRNVAVIGFGVTVGRSKLGRAAGQGLLAERPFKKGEFITEYNGWTLSRDDADLLRRERRAAWVRCLEMRHAYLDGIREAVLGVGGGSLCNDNAKSIGGVGNNSVWERWWDPLEARWRLFVLAVRDVEVSISTDTS